MLEVCQLHANQGNTPVLRGVSLQVRPGEIVALLGRNGSGRSTMAQALMGLCQPLQGEVRWHGRSLIGCPTYDIARKGIAYVAEERAVFPTLTVHQNLLLGMPDGPRPVQSPWHIDQVYDLFPRLAARRQTPAAVLSGGEQQLLVLGRALLGSPELMLIDEPTEGLSPLLVECVADLLQRLRSSGVGVLLIEHKLPLAMALADRVLVMGRGQIVFEGLPDELRHPQSLHNDWLEPW